MSASSPASLEPCCQGFQITMISDGVNQISFVENFDCENPLR
jgi:hypothetical protein